MFRKPVPHDVAVPQHPHLAYGAAVGAQNLSKPRKKLSKIEILTSELISSLFKGLRLEYVYALDWMTPRHTVRNLFCFLLKHCLCLLALACFAWRWRSRIILSSNSWMGYLTRTLLCNSLCTGAFEGICWICLNHLMLDKLLCNRRYSNSISKKMSIKYTNKVYISRNERKMMSIILDCQNTPQIFPMLRWEKLKVKLHKG
jgi:hypothetical protein